MQATELMSYKRSAKGKRIAAKSNIKLLYGSKQIRTTSDGYPRDFTHDNINSRDAADKLLKKSVTGNTFVKGSKQTNGS